MDEKIELDQALIDGMLAVFLAENGIVARPGVAMHRDEFGQEYTMLVQGIPVEKGIVPGNVPIYSTPGASMWRQFCSELLLWLQGRNRIVWRSPPALEERSDLLAQDARTIENIEDNYPAKIRSVKVYYIYCRLTAYRA